MARSSEANSGAPGGQEKEGWRHFGDGIVGRFIAARIQGYSPTALGYVDVQVDVDGVVQTASSGGGGGGAVTIADGANVAQGSTTDLSSANTVVGILKAIKALLAGTLSTSAAVSNFPATQAVSIASMPSTPVTGPLTDTQLRLTPVPVSLASAPTTAVTQSTSPWVTNDPGLPDTLGQKTMAASTGVVLASDQTSVPVAATLAAETTKVLGVTRTADGAGNLVTSTTNALDINIKSGNPTAITANAGTNLNTSALALDATLTGRTQKSQVTDGTRDGTVKAASTLPVATDTALVVTARDTVTTNATLTAETTKVIGTVNVAAAQTIAVTGTFFQATQPVSAATLPLPTGAATSASQSTVKAASTLAAATDTAQVVTQSPMRADASTLAVTNTAATGAACTLTIPAAAAGLFHYITMISFRLTATTARTGTAPILVTSTNLPGSPVWDFDTSQAVGTTIRENIVPGTPIKSSVAATATTIVAPIATTGLWRITAHYFTAP